MTSTLSATHAGRKRCTERWDGRPSPYPPAGGGHGRNHECARPPEHPPPCMCYCGERPACTAPGRPGPSAPVTRAPKARRTSRLDCGHWARPGNRIAHVDGRGWLCLPCVLATIALNGWCARCRQPVHRYGPGGNPLCRDCRCAADVSHVIGTLVGMTADLGHCTHYHDLVSLADWHVSCCEGRHDDDATCYCPAHAGGSSGAHSPQTATARGWLARGAPPGGVPTADRLRPDRVPVHRWPHVRGHQWLQRV